MYRQGAAAGRLRSKPHAACLINPHASAGESELDSWSRIVARRWGFLTAAAAAAAAAVVLLQRADLAGRCSITLDGPPARRFGVEGGG